MPRDKSLDEFLSADEENEDAGSSEDETPPRDGNDPEPVGEDESGLTGEDDPEVAGEDESELADEGESEPTDGDVTPAVATFHASPDGSPCEACGETVTRAWRDGDRIVCGECKDW